MKFIILCAVIMLIMRLSDSPLVQRMVGLVGYLVGRLYHVTFCWRFVRSNGYAPSIDIRGKKAHTVSKVLKISVDIGPYWYRREVRNEPVRRTSQIPPSTNIKSFWSPKRNVPLGVQRTNFSMCAKLGRLDPLLFSRTIDSGPVFSVSWDFFYPSHGPGTAHTGYQDFKVASRP